MVFISTIKIKTNTKSHKPGKTSNPSLLADGDSVERSIKKYTKTYSNTSKPTRYILTF